MYIESSYRTVKMPSQTLLGIDPEELFQKHNIGEIKSIQLEIQNEIEKKREELRTMVGEKCRDLLKAADTITEMRETSRNVLSNINQTKQLCQALQEKRLLGFRQHSNKVTFPLLNNAEEISKIIEIKILLALPEQIWMAIDNKDYLLSAQLFLFATHLHLGLEVSSSAQKITNEYPVLSKQWEVISACKKVIINETHKELKVIDLSQEKAGKYLCCLILLEVITYEKLLERFLNLRMLALQDVLKSEELSRKKLRLIITILQHTLVILYYCFLDKPGKKADIHNQLETITGDQGKPTLSKMIQVSSLPERYLSPIVLNYQPKPPNNLTTLTQEHIKNSLSKWLENVETLLQVELTKLLLLIDEIKRLNNIIKEVLSLEYPNDWDEIVDSLLGYKKLNFYHKFIKNYVTERIMSLIEIAWQNSLNNVLICLTKMDEDALKDRGKQPENDIRWFVWKENKVDFEENLKMKTLGYTTRVMELCRKMDSFLVQLLADVKLYLGDDLASKSKTDYNNDADIILPFLNNCSFEMIKRFTQFVEDSYKERENLNNESNLIIRARFLSSLTTQSPGLEECLKLNQNSLQEDYEKNKINNTWQEASVFLNEKSIQMWHIWRTLMSSKLRNLIKSKLDETISLKNLLKSKPLSEIVTIEEQTEDGTTVKSDLRVPSQPSLPLQELLFEICQQLNSVIPHTLPRRIHQDLVDGLVKDLLEHYQKWSKSEVIYQSQAWQMLLDIRFLTLMLVTKENKDLSESICETLEKTIDPFDLDVYFPHLQNSVKKSTQKLQGTVGILVNFSEKLPVFNGLKLTQSNTNSKVEEPNLLAVSSNVPWFPLLPTINLGSRRFDSSRVDGQDSSMYKELSAEKNNLRSKEKEKKESVTSDFFKSAGAFFDAMTGGWS